MLNPLILIMVASFIVICISLIVFGVHKINKKERIRKEELNREEEEAYLRWRTNLELQKAAYELNTPTEEINSSRDRDITKRSIKWK